MQQRVASVPDTYGRSKAAENFAEQQWTGFEMSLRYSNHIGNVNYSVNANMGYVKDKWTKFDEPENLSGWKSRIGYPNDFLKGYVCEGIIRTQEQLDALPEGFTQFGTVSYTNLRMSSLPAAMYTGMHLTAMPRYLSPVTVPDNRSN